MNAAIFASLPASACTLGTTGTLGPDRISKTTYDVLGRPIKTVAGYAVMNGGAGETEIELGYTANGQISWRKDGNGNQTNYTYDVYDRLYRTTFPDASYEQLTYDTRGNILTLRKRAGQIITNAYDNAGRMTQSSYSNGDPTVTYAYDALGREVTLTRTGVSTIGYSYDALGRRASVVQDGRTLSYQYDIAGRRTRLTHPDSFYITYDYSPAGQVTAIRENGSTALVTYAYDGLGRATSLSRANGKVTNLTYDPVSRLATYDHVGLVNAGFTYNPASQLVTSSLSNDAYAFTANYNVNRNYGINNLNQYTTAGPASFSYDLNGNLTGDGTSTYVYDALNRLKSASGGSSATLTYDATGRLIQTAGSTTTKLLYDGDELVAEYNSAGTLLRRYVHGAGSDDPLVWYEGTGTSDKRYLTTDERGSITAITNAAGGVININSYDEWGIPAATNLGRFQYTGQQWLPEIGMYYYKARIYSPTLGRFLQTDPIGYKDGMNMYAYAGNDPVNGSDPTGLCTGSRVSNNDGTCASTGGFTTGSDGAAQGMQIAAAAKRDQLSSQGIGTNVSQHGVSSSSSDEGVQNASASGTSIGPWVIPDGGSTLDAIKAGFMKAGFAGSAMKDQPDVRFARNRVLLGIAVREGTFFRIPSNTYVLGSALLQYKIDGPRGSGIVEWIMPFNMRYFSGNPVITHARYISGAGVTGYPNNFGGRYNCKPPSCI